MADVNTSDVTFKEYNTLEELQAWVADSAKHYEASVTGTPIKKVAHLLFNIVTSDQQQDGHNKSHG